MSRIDSAPPPQANPDVRPPSRSRGPDGPGRFVWESLRMAWRWLTRMRTALYLLGLLALETLLATVVPQEPNVPGTVAAWRAGTEGPGRAVSVLLDAVGGYDVYGSPAFLALLLLLFTSLTACLIPRYRAWLRMVRRSRPPRARRPERQQHVATFTTAATPDAALAEARGALRRRRYRLRDDGPAGEGYPAQVAGERGHVAREGGSLLFHTSFYVLLIAIVLGQLLGFSGQVGVVEGEAFADTPIAYWTYQPGRWFGETDHRGWRLELDEFRVDWFRDPQFAGTPRLFESDVTFTLPDGTTIQRLIEGNEPAVVEDFKVHQLDWGYAPRVVVEVDGEAVFDDYVTASPNEVAGFSTAVKAPRANPDVGLDVQLFPFAPTGEDGVPAFTGAPWAEAPLLVFQTFRGDLQLEASQSVRELDTEKLTAGGGGLLRPGEEIALDDGVTVRFADLRRWVGFQVSYRPTVPYLLLAAGLILAGLLPSLYAYRRRVWVAARRDPDSRRTLVTVAGRAFQRVEAFAVEHEEIAGELSDALDAGRTEVVDPPRVPAGVGTETAADRPDRGAP